METGAPLVIVTDPQTLWLTIDAPESLSGAFRVGGTLRFSVPAYPAESFAARVDAVGAGLDPNTRTLPVRATVDNRRAQLKPEMLATVTAEGGRPVAAATLWFVALIALPATYLLPWRPGNLPPTSIEFVFIIAKLSLSAIMFAIGAALVTYEASRVPPSPRDPASAATAVA